MDYKVRGFTRDVKGRKVYIDHDITSIQDYISDEILDRYTAYDINIVSDNIFHTKMMLRKFKLENYLFGPESGNLTQTAKSKISKMLRKEMLENLRMQKPVQRRLTMNRTMSDCSNNTLHREWLNERFGYFYTVNKQLRSHSTAFQKLDLVDTDEFGRVLILDGITQIAEKNEFQYHEPMVHPALCTHPDPRRVLVIGAGDGAILREVLKYPNVESVDLAELDEGVIRFSKKFLASVHRRAFADPRVHVHIVDGRNFVECNQRTFDVVIMDMTDPFRAVEVPLYKRLFYAGKEVLPDAAGRFFHAYRISHHAPEHVRLHTEDPEIGLQPCPADVPLYTDVRGAVVDHRRVGRLRYGFRQRGGG